MKKIIYALIVLIAASCSKQDYGYLNTDRRPMVIRVSERYTNPLNIAANGTWLPYKVISDTLDRNTRANDYENLKADTIPEKGFSSCSIDKKDSAFLKEIRKYIVIKF